LGRDSFQRYAYSLSFYDHEVGYVTTCNNLGSDYYGICRLSTLKFLLLSLKVFVLLKATFQNAFMMLSRCFQDDVEISPLNGIVFFNTIDCLSLRFIVF
jgi:hypothetical protein